MKVKLYTTLGCHLCEEALELLKQLKTSGLEIEISEIEIADSDELMSAFGVRIPVITTENSEDEIGWPFTIEELKAFLE
jgi:glutaredoxin